MSSMPVAYAMMMKKKKMAEGGDVSFEHEEKESGYDREVDGMCAGGDVVDRVMAKKYASGGKVANDDEKEMADMEPNNFDDLALDDHIGKEADYTGADEGDEIGDERFEHDKKDIISRIMKSRALKGQMPRIP